MFGVLGFIDRITKMANCSECGGRLGIFDTKGVCSKQACIKNYRKKVSDTKSTLLVEQAAKQTEALGLLEDERQKRDAIINEIMLTTETAPNLNITKRIEIVTAECAFGMNMFKDLFAGVRDIVGGRSEAVQDTMRDARRNALYELKKEAYEVGANAVVGVDLDYVELSNAGSMVMLVASGTAVIIEEE